jgi:foldase protein PrsA
MFRARSKFIPIAVLTLTVALAGPTARGQGLINRITGRAPAASDKDKPAADTASPAAAAGAARVAEPAGSFEVKAHLVNPSEPIAIINGEPITRQQLADECVAQKGAEILETLIARRLIDQAVRASKMEITPAEINAEIDRVAMNVAQVSREKWLATLDKERKISPERYARDVIYPALALRKLSAPMVQVTEADLKQAFQSQFGERVKCRMILLNSMPIAREVWEELKKNPSLFEKLAQERSIDPATRSVGGMLPDPIARFAQPREVSDKVFAQLVDLDPNLNPQSPDFEKYRPKDGDVTGIIQVTEATWAIFRREGLVPARQYNTDDPALQKQLREAVYEAKLQEQMSILVQGMMLDAAIENRLTGQVKLSKQEESNAPVDIQIKQASTPPATTMPSTTAGQAPPPGVTPPAPAAPAAPGQPPARITKPGFVPPGVNPADAGNVKELRKN